MSKAVLLWVYQWLPIIMGCHCRPDRSFFLRGKQFPVCARCTGVIGGCLLSLLIFFLYVPPAALLILLAVPMVIDGGIQGFCRRLCYESTNVRRLITGIGFGYGIGGLFLMSLRAVYRFGYHLVR